MDKILKGGGAVSLDIEVGKTTRHHKKGRIFKAEANLLMGKKILRAEAFGEDPHEAVDLLKEELETEEVVLELAEAPLSGAEAEPIVVAGSTIVTPGALQRLLASPGRVWDYMLGASLVILLFALLLKIFVKIHIQHPALIANGVLAVAIVLVLLVLNHELVRLPGLVF